MNYTTYLCLRKALLYYGMQDKRIVGNIIIQEYMYLYLL